MLNKCIRRYFFSLSRQRSKKKKKIKTPDLRLQIGLQRFMVDQYYNTFFHPTIMVLVNKRLITILTTKRYHDNVITRYKHPFEPNLLIT